ncbi:MAG: hypothetical protein A2Y25_05605 [Candidatus Melainabacteria bacterium GWF2_37_15]|nr:MAG: hypothetical protein A2Y25_05605 [Candidatus Melainabacteria bacterium GWF2_37_15]
MKNSLKLTAVILFSIFTVNSAPSQNAMEVKPIELVNNPAVYLNKDVKMSAQFDKFSTLGLDYKKAFRDSKDYISVLIKRPDVNKEYTIPLSELKLILKREAAEKLLDIESGDRVQIVGKVFSTALNDPWVDVTELKNLDPDKKKDLDEDTDL